MHLFALFDVNSLFKMSQLLLIFMNPHRKISVFRKWEFKSNCLFCKRFLTLIGTESLKAERMVTLNICSAQNINYQQAHCLLLHNVCFFFSATQHSNISTPGGTYRNTNGYRSQSWPQSIYSLHAGC